MNYYQKNIGDWAIATAHLSEVEECIYSRCIEQYYSTEKPLPTDQKQVARLVRARTKEAIAAVDVVLNEFFTLADDGWHQKRCDAELSIYKDKQDKAKRSANARWKPSADQCERNANALPTQCEGNAKQEPITNNHKPIGLSLVVVDAVEPEKPQQQQQFPMHTDWLPDSEFENQMFAAGIPIEVKWIRYLDEFTLYWRSRPEVTQNHYGWQNKFLKCIIGSLKNDQMNLR